ncbi:BspA family leucine-rich repeat surface protein [Listeria seeligeri]|uniref:BspA family leucine-rich repeat surface protein n=1 Tax=Listeria seeligeri TaxID=1640 RepID=UPI0018873982|nr:BspA family leucine-rich repeat surface protein [Listeria seeligeri]MBF2397069.1 BspA family leucine-rich repeat surface protein [Listeria seeligeri]MBF2454412.1 BspA family leucine-rich repeat surface protein [Listeria seeligeri]MBF2670125.1 BspA family leucine-rich repeat surface protein [Listeria seeligeri]
MKSNRIYIFLFVIVMGIMIVSQAHSLLANYNIVEDMSLQTSVTSLKEGEVVAVTVTDSNVEDTKLVIPIDKTMEYVESDHLDGSVVFDTINDQLVIDWVESSNEQKVVTVMLKMNKEGLYSLKALTVRDNQEISTREVSLDVVGTEESQIEDVGIENSMSSEQTMTDESDVEDSTLVKSTITGKWGTSPWTYDKESKKITIETGKLGRWTEAPWQKNNSVIIKTIELIGDIKAPENSKQLFAWNPVTEIIGLSNLDTSDVTNMESMFSSSSAMSLDLSGFDTSNVTSMSRMFHNTSGLTSIDLSGFDTSKVTNMASMFEKSSLISLDLSGFDTSKVMLMISMFAESSLISLDLSGFNTSNVTSMSQMFNNASGLTSINLSGFDTSNVTNMSQMFNNASGLTSIDLSSFNTSKVTNMSQMFNNARGLTSIDLSGFDTSNVTNMSQMFNNASGLTSIDLSSFNTSNVTNMTQMFVANGNNLEYLDISGFDTTKAKGKMEYFFGAHSFKKIILGPKTDFKNAYSVSIGTPAALNPDDRLTGKWTREDGKSEGYFPSDFLQKYGENDLKAGAYVAEIIPFGEITSDTKLINLTHPDDLFFVNDEVKLENNIHHKGQVWNYLYKTTIPKALTVNDESFKGYTITEEGQRIEFPDEVFNFDESSQVLEVNLKNISEQDSKGNYYSTVDADFYYELVGTVDRESIGQTFKLDTSIHYFDFQLTPYKDINQTTGAKRIYGLEPEWKLEKKIKNTSRSDEITAVGDELEFTLTATNKEELGAMKNFAITETMFPNELDFIRGSAELILPNGMTKKLDDSVYQADKQIISADVFSENGYVGVEPYSFRFKAKVKDVAYGKILETKANLNGLTQTGNVVNIDDNKVEINVAYSGKLGFKETPKTLSFKDSFISTFTSTIERKDADWGISIEDTRAQKQPWTLSVKQASPFESMDGDTLTQVLIFRKNGVEDKGIDVENEVDVYSEKSPNLNDYFVSWQKDEGFFLKVPPGTAKAKQYQTELQWNLKDTPI